MLDTRMRPLIDRPLNAAGRALARRGASANGVTMAGLGVGLLAAVAIAMSQFTFGFALIVVNRILDGLDGAVARATTTTDSGGYLDIVADYVFYGSVPLAFAIADPGENAIAVSPPALDDVLRYRFYGRRDRHSLSAQSNNRHAAHTRTTAVGLSLSQRS
jgi:hypothetical protein